MFETSYAKVFQFLLLARTRPLWSQCQTLDGVRVGTGALAQIMFTHAHTIAYLLPSDVIYRTHIYTCQFPKVVCHINVYYHSTRSGYKQHTCRQFHTFYFSLSRVSRKWQETSSSYVMAWCGFLLDCVINFRCRVFFFFFLLISIFYR